MLTHVKILGFVYYCYLCNQQECLWNKEHGALCMPTALSHGFTVEVQIFTCCRHSGERRWRVPIQGNV